MKAKDLVVPAVAIGGGYIVVTRILKLIPDPLAGIGGISDWFNNLFKSQTGLFTFSRDSARQGETFAISSTGLKPNTPLIYGWKEIGFSTTVTTDANGNWTSPSILVAFSTPPGVYTIYLDQRPWGGAYGERRFTVLA